MIQNDLNNLLPPGPNSLPRNDASALKFVAIILSRSDICGLISHTDIRIRELFFINTKEVCRDGIIDINLKHHFNIRQTVFF